MKRFNHIQWAALIILFPWVCAIIFVVMHSERIDELCNEGERAIVEYLKNIWM